MTLTQESTQELCSGHSPGGQVGPGHYVSWFLTILLWPVEKKHGMLKVTCLIFVFFFALQVCTKQTEGSQERKVFPSSEFQVTTGFVVLFILNLNLQLEGVSY